MNLKPQISPATFKGIRHLAMGEVDFMAQLPDGSFEHFRLCGGREAGFGKTEHLVKNVKTGSKKWMLLEHLTTKKYDGNNRYNPWEKPEWAKRKGMETKKIGKTT